MGTEVVMVTLTNDLETQNSLGLEETLVNTLPNDKDIEVLEGDLNCKGQGQNPDFLALVLFSFINPALCY